MYIYITKYALPKILTFLVDQTFTFDILGSMAIDHSYVMFLRHEKLKMTRTVIETNLKKTKTTQTPIRKYNTREEQEDLVAIRSTSTDKKG